MNTYDTKYIQMIRDFLAEESIDYNESIINDNHTFLLNDGKLHVVYVNSWDNKMDYSKRFGIQGVPADKFIEQTKDNTGNGIRTIYIKDFEIYSCEDVPQVDGSILRDYHRKFEVVKSYICGATNNIKNRVYARHTEVKVVSNHELRPFLNTNCFYGYRAANTNLGLYMKRDHGKYRKGDLVMVYTFGHGFFGQNKWDIEIIRVATCLHTQVVGGASKLLKHFLENYPVLRIGNNNVETNRMVYYVDADHNTGNSLKTLGFDYVEHNGPGFINMWAVDCEHGKKGETFSRKPALHKTIMKYMSEGKVISIPHAGTIVYVLDRNTYQSGKYSLDNIRTHFDRLFDFE